MHKFLLKYKHGGRPSTAGVRTHLTESIVCGQQNIGLSEYLSAIQNLNRIFDLLFSFVDRNIIGLSNKTVNLEICFVYEIIYSRYIRG